MNPKRKLYKVALYMAKTWHKRVTESKLNGKEVFEKYVGNNVYGSRDMRMCTRTAIVIQLAGRAEQEVLYIDR